jgi:hypothetical protein
MYCVGDSVQPIHIHAPSQLVILCDAVESPSTLLLGRLRMRFEVTTNPIPNHGESEFFKHVALTRGEVQQPPSQSIVVLSLFSCVVARRVLKVFFLILQEIIFQLKKTKEGGKVSTKFGP